MPFSPAIREDVLVRSRRHCCVCNRFSGRDVNVHHIVHEADGGTNAIENAIALCLCCHAEAGHYNPKHPLGTKYSPAELRRHRDAWWGYCASGFASELRPEGYAEPLTSGRACSVQRVEVGTVWSRLLNRPVWEEVIEFEGVKVAECAREDAAGRRWSTLYARPDGSYLVHLTTIRGGADYCEAYLDGERGFHSLHIEEVQERHPELATLAGLKRVRLLT